MRFLTFLSGLLLLLAVSTACLAYSEGADRKASTSAVCGLEPRSAFTLYSDRVVTPEGVVAAEIDVRDGKITSVRQVSKSRARELVGDNSVLNYEGLVLSPGLVDTHVHLNEPGRTAWEGFRTGTMAAAAGGITTLVDMPLNNIPPTTTLEALELKRQVSASKLWVDVAFWGGLVPSNAANVTILEELFQAGAVGLKGFLCESGVEEFPPITASEIKAALPILAKYKKPLVLHSELSPDSASLHLAGDPRRYQTYLDSRPVTLEVGAVKLVAELARSTAVGQPNEGARLHIVHLAAADCIPIIQEAKRFGADLTAQACPHYLSFAAEAIPDGQTQYKCAPPIREAANRERLWAGLMDGSINFLASDHSPSLPELKHLDDGDFMQAWGGVAGLQFDLMASWTAGQSRGATLGHLAQWWSEVPARYMALSQKGSIEVGKDADFVIWDPNAEVTVDSDFKIYHRYNVTPYMGMTFSARIWHTVVRGQFVYSNDNLSRTPCGKQLVPDSLLDLDGGSLDSLVETRNGVQEAE